MMRHALGGIVAAVCLAGTARADAPAAARPEVLTLEQAVALALEGNRDVRNAALEVSKSEDELGSYRTQGLPQVNVYALDSRTLTEG